MSNGQQYTALPRDPPYDANGEPLPDDLCARRTDAATQIVPTPRSTARGPVWRTAGHAVLRSKVGRDRMRSASEKLARSNATVPLPALKTLLAGRAGIRPIRAAPRFSPTISLIQRSSQKKRIERRKKKTVEMYCNFLRLLFVARNRNRVVPTKRFSGHVASLQGATRSYGTSK